MYCEHMLACIIRRGSCASVNMHSFHYSCVYGFLLINVICAYLLVVEAVGSCPLLNRP